MANPDYYILGYAIDGKADYSFSGRNYTVRKGDILFFPTLGQVLTNTHTIDYVPLFSELNWVWNRKHPGYLIRCRSLLMEILYFLIREQSASNTIPHARTIENIVNKLQRNYSQTYSIETLAREAGFSPSYFRLLFNQVSGFKPHQYQNFLKINRAKDLLLSGECNVSEAAIMLGFENIYYFSRLFKKMTGTNPSEYKND